MGFKSRVPKPLLVGWGKRPEQVSFCIRDGVSFFGEKCKFVLLPRLLSMIVLTTALSTAEGFFCLVRMAALRLCSPRTAILFL